MNRTVKSQSAFGRTTTEWTRWVAFGFLLLLLSFLQSAPYALQIAGAKPLLLLACPICIALFTGPVGGGIAGAFAGILWDLFAGRILGFNGILLLVLGTTAGLLVWLVMRNNMLTAILMVGCASLIQNLMDWIFSYVLYDRGDVLKALWSVYLPNGLYTLIISPLMYFLVFGIMKYTMKRT